MVKVERTFPAPASLAKEAEKKSGSYSEKDVMEQLRHDFNDKCYICEIKGLQDPQVEHLLPHKNGKYHDRKFDWNNLFWSCGHCNNVKNQEKYDDGIIDCCREDPERYLNFRLIDGEVSVTSKDGKNVVAERTAILVREVFSLKNTGMRVYKSDKRFKELSKEMNVLYDNLEAVRKNPDSPTALRKLKALLRRESAFAAFKRCYVREHLQEFPQLLGYIGEPPIS